MLALNTYSFQTIKLKLAAFLPSAAPTGEACGAHVFEGFVGLENGPVKSDKSQTLFGKEMPEDASRHPKPTSYPQTRQDTVVEHSWNMTYTLSNAALRTHGLHIL